MSALALALGIHVDDRGAGEPVVLLHSSGMSGEQWRRTADALLPAGLRAVVPDLSGSGRSPAWPDGQPFGFADDVEVVDRLLGELARPVHLVGHSYGGFIALKVAALDPARVRSLALYDPVAFGVLDRERDREALAEAWRVESGWGQSPAEREAWLEYFVDYWGGAGAWSRLRDPARAEFRRIGWVVQAGARSLVADTTPAAAYRAIAAPTLLISGGQSPLAAQRIVAHLAEALPAARVERFDDAGHMGPLTHGKRLQELLLRHVETAGETAESVSASDIRPG